MPDAMDAVQQFNADHDAASLARHAQRVRLPGRSVCASDECGAPISPERQADGAQLCVPCKSAEEARSAHFRAWAGSR